MQLLGGDGDRQHAGKALDDLVELRLIVIDEQQRLGKQIETRCYGGDIARLSLPVDLNRGEV